MKHTLLSIALSLQAGIAAMAATNDVASPDGRLVVTVGDEGGRIFYSVKYDGKPMIEKSSLGLKANIGDFSTGLRERAVSTKQTDTTYTMRGTKASKVRYVANQMGIIYENAGKDLMTVTFNVSDNDVAFRYTFPQQGETACMVVESEAWAVDGIHKPAGRPDDRLEAHKTQLRRGLLGRRAAHRQVAVRAGLRVPGAVPRGRRRLGAT